jgi:DNA-binding CsgD family transcriptional regulator
MSALINHALDLAETCIRTDVPDDIGRTFFSVLRPYGLKAIFARAHDVWDAAAEPHVYARISPDGWEEAYASEGLGRINPITRATRSRAHSFVWSDLGLKTPGERKMWGMLHDFGCHDGIAVPCHGTDGHIGVVSLAFERLGELSHSERRAIEYAALLAHQRLRDLKPPTHFRPIKSLTSRERDCLGFVANGKTDWEISAILSISQATVHSHIENAKRKLDARSRAQAVARVVYLGLI